MDTRDPAKKEIPTIYQRDMGLFPDNPRALDFFIIEAEYAGNYAFDLSINGSLSLTLERRLITTPIDIGDWTLKFYLAIDGIDYEFDTDYSGTEATETLGATNFTTSYAGTHTVQAGQRIYIYGVFTFDPSRDNWRGSSWSLTNYATTYDISATTVTANSQTYCYKVIDCLDHVMSAISDNDAIVLSDYYDNCAGNLAILNGFFLRYANIASFPTDLTYPVLSFKTLIGSLQAIHGVGVGYERDDEGNDIVRVEPYDYFYQDEEIMDITDFIIPTTYQEEVASDLIYSELNIGYSKFPKEDSNGLDEFNTELTAQSPIKYHSNKFEQKSGIIGSGYLIESVRRQALQNAESKQSTDYDDDNFFVCLDPTPNSASITGIEVHFRQPHQGYINEFDELVYYDPGNAFLTTEGISLFAGSAITITGSTYNNGTFTVISVVSITFNSVLTYEVTVQETMVYEPNAIINITFVTVPLVAEKDSLFTITSGSLLAPETAYNVRINPVYMLLQHSKLLNSGYFYKSSGDKIKVKKFTQNADFEVQRKVGETCINNDPDRQVYKMNADITLGNFNDKESFFTPEYIKVQAIMQPEQIKYIINAHRNLNTTGKNYGYLTLTNPEGEIWQCYLNELNILENGIENRVEFVLIKKKT